MKETIRPPALRPGDEIRVIAPASAPDMKNLSRSIGKLRKLGFRVSLGKNIKKLVQINQTAAKDSERSEELAGAFLDDNVKAVFCARGGYGSIHILPLLDYDAIREHPKIFMGYSDITALHMAINSKAGLVTFHGPMPASDPDEIAKHSFGSFLDVLEGASRVIEPDYNRVVKYIIPGTAEGISMGTNISVAASLIGTEYMPDTGNKLFFVEDTGVTPGDIDRYFFTMRLAGLLEKFSGFVFGELKVIKEVDEPMPFIEDVVQGIMSECNRPSVYGMPFGHGDEQMLIPLNARMRLNTTEPHLELLENVVD